MAALAFVFSTRIAREMRDFEVYWTAAQRAAAAQPLYRADDGHFQFKYLPAFAVLAAPAAAVSLPSAKAAWFSVSAGLLVALVALSIAILPERRRPLWFLAIVVVISMAKFYGHELTLGQVNLLLAVMVTGAVLLFIRGNDVLASTLMVGAVVVKPYAVLLLPWLAVRGGWRATATATAGIVAVAMIPLPLYGFAGTLELHREWWATVTTSTAPNLTNPDNVSIAAFAAKWLGSGGRASVFAAILAILCVAIAVAIIAAGKRVRRPEPLEAAVILTLMPLLSPQGWDYVFLAATPAVALIANYSDLLPRALRIAAWTSLAVIGLSLFDVLGRQRYAIFMAWSVITLCFFVVLMALATLRLRRAA